MTQRPAQRRIRAALERDGAPGQRRDKGEEERRHDKILSVFTVFAGSPGAFEIRPE